MKFLLLLICSVALNTIGSFGQSSLKVMTYNIRFDNPGDGVNQWSERSQQVVALLKKYDPDIIGVQEALLHQLEDIEESLEGYTFVGAGRDDGKKKGEFSAIFFKTNRLILLEEDTYWLSQTPDTPGSKSWDAAITRVATWARFRDKQGGKEFLFVNTHFDHVGAEARANSAKLLKEKTKKLAGDLPVLITGDFNAEPSEKPYITMTDQEKLPLIDSAPVNAPGTFCTFVVNAEKCRLIDYIFHSPEWSTSDFQVITDNDGKHYPSDHLPVIVTVSR